MSELKSKYDLIIDRLKAEGKTVTIINEKKKVEIVTEVEKELAQYRFENQKRIRESQEHIAGLVLTS